MTYSPGTLVRARSREWVVQPGSTADAVVLKPLGGLDAEVTAIATALESIEEARFPPPDPSKLGDHLSSRLLRDAVRLSTRAGAGPFRCFGRIAVEPRPYQLVPLMLGLRLDPIRMLIADDVGIGKTIEACLLVRELLDRGEIDRFCVLCPPHLAEQWQGELSSKFHLDAELVLPSTAARLERQIRGSQSIFDVFRFTIVSTDFIKSDRRRHDFVRAAPELLVVDEAHTCADAGVAAHSGRTGRRQQRHELLKSLAADQDRHLLLVTATPHSGKDAAFRSLLSLIDPAFGDLPEDLAGDENRRHREQLARHMVQRRRPDIEDYLSERTEFPEREDAKPEPSYTLSEPYKRLFNKVLAYARETVEEQGTGRRMQRVRWWSALALLRSLASSPAAAAATLRNRAPDPETEDLDDLDQAARRHVFDTDPEESEESIDVPLGADTSPEAPEPHADDHQNPVRRRLLEMAREADRLHGDHDHKLVEATTLVRRLLKEEHNPIVFCRFIPTAEYVGEELRSRLPKSVTVEVVTGNLPPEERERRVTALGQHESRVLVCTDCLSEGINLQDHFDAVFHYDLAWNPTRHEQREGRVDRFGQKRRKVRVVTFYGADNRIDGIVLDVLIRKHKKIRKALGISVPVPVETDQVMNAILEGLLLRQGAGEEQLALQYSQQAQQLDIEWEAAADREKRSRSIFAQRTIDPTEVATELQAARATTGAGVDVEHFFTTVITRCDGLVGLPTKVGTAHEFDVARASRTLTDALGLGTKFRARFSGAPQKAEVLLLRTHPVVQSLATYVLDLALDPEIDSTEYGVARRCGAIRTTGVQVRTTLLLLRSRYDIISARRHGSEYRQLAEDCHVLAFEGPPQEARWLDEETADRLLQLAPSGNVPHQQAEDLVHRVIDSYDDLIPAMDNASTERSAKLDDAHRRVRSAVRLRGLSTKVEPHLPPDLIGVYVFIPS